MHDLISSWATEHLEKTPYDGNNNLFDLGLRAIGELYFMMYLSLAMRDKKHGFAYDFKNFNSQHSQRDMSRYYNLLKLACAWTQMLIGWEPWIGWWNRLIVHTIIRSSRQKEFLLATSGWLSGIQATQGINTSLDMSYIYVVKQCVDRLLGGNITWSGPKLHDFGFQNVKGFPVGTWRIIPWLSPLK